jgi:hypothetical protein
MRCGDSLSPVFDPAHGTEQRKPCLGELEPCFQHINEVGALADVGTLLVFGERRRAARGRTAHLQLRCDGVELVLSQFVLQFRYLLLGTQFGNVLLQLQYLLIGLVAQLIGLGGGMRRFGARAFGLRGARCVEQRQVDLDANIEVVVLVSETMSVGLRPVR